MNSVLPRLGRFSLAFYVLFIAVMPGWAQTTDDLRQQGIQAMQAHNFASARKAFQQLAERQPSADNYNMLATAEAAAGLVEPAIAHLRKSMQLGNHTAGAHYNLGILEMQAQQVDAAQAAFQEAINLDPKYLPARYGLGVALLSSGQARAAAALTEKSLQQTPHESRFWALLVSAQFVAGDAQRAVVSTQNALQDYPDDARLDVTLATICLRYRQVQRARELLEDANELMPNVPEVALLLARASLMAGEPVEAMAVLQGMAPADRKGSERRLLMGQTHALLGDLNSAAEDLRLALNDAPHNPDYLAAYAWLQNLQGNFDGAIATLTTARSLLPHEAWVPYRIAVSYYFLKQYAQVERSCAEALQLDPDYAPADVLRGLAKLAQKHFEAARIDIAKAVDLDPDNPLFRRELGMTLYDSGKPGLAGQQFNLALRRNPKDADAYFWRAKALEAIGEKAQAIADLNTVITLKPGYADAYTELSRLYAETGRPSRAAEILARQKRAGTSSPSPADDPLLRSLPDPPQ